MTAFGGALALLSAVPAALSYDLAKYPGAFISDGIFNGTIVLGEQAAVSDVLGAIDIAASLQAQSTTKTTTYHGISISGDAKAINGGKLQLRKKPSSLLTEKDIKAFARGSITNARGSTEYLQFLRLGSTGMQQLTANYLQDEDDHLRDYLVLNDDAPFFEWEEQFASGLESQRDSSGALTDLEDVQLGLVGLNATIVSAEISAAGTDLVLTLMGGTSGDTLREGDTKTYSVDGQDYEVTLVFVSDPNTGTPEVKFSVNGEITQALSEGDTDTISGGLQIGVRDILVNAREGVASFYLGAKKITISDPTPTAENFDGSVEVDNEHVSGGSFQTVGYYDETNSTFRIAWMKYQYTANPAAGSTIFLTNGAVLRPLLDHPEGMLSDIDFHYHGITDMDTKNLSIEHRVTMRTR
jgi:hypothetical protein